MTQRSFTSQFALVLGAFLIVQGVWELFSPVVFGVLTSNTLHGIIHIALGAVGVWLGWKGGGRGWAIFLGLLLIVVGLLYYIPGAHDLVVSLFNLNQAVAIVNFILGAISLLVAFTSKSARMT